VNLASAMGNGPELLTVKEAADLLRMNPSYLASRLAAGEYPVEVAFRVGRTWRVDRARLLEWFQNREQLRRRAGSRKATAAAPSLANMANGKRRRRA
jgi:excisionase family DNA binding protein